MTMELRQRFEVYAVRRAPHPADLLAAYSGSAAATHQLAEALYLDAVRAMTTGDASQWANVHEWTAVQLLGPNGFTMRCNREPEHAA